MTTNVTGPTSIVPSGRRFFSKTRFFVLLGLVVLLVFSLVLAWMTRDALVQFRLLREKRIKSSHVTSQNTIVDVTPWQTAQSLQAMAVSLAEAEYAREAEHLAEHDVDQAFASALRVASTKQRVLTGEALSLSKKLAQMQQVVLQDQARVQSLTATAKTSGASKSRAGSAILADDLDVAKAQLGLDSDELTDAQQDLGRAIGDERNRIQQELAAHGSALREYEAQLAKKIQAAPVTPYRANSVAELIETWFSQRSRYKLIQQAMQRAQASAAALLASHNRLEGETKAAQASNDAILPAPGPSGTATQAAGKTEVLAALSNRAARHQLLSIYDDRINTEQQLAAVYGKWSAQVLAQHRIVVHRLLQSLALITFIVICVILVETLVLHLVDRPKLDRRRMHTLRVLFKIGIQLCGVLIIVLVIFGTPSHMPTIIGFTTAGITVVLQDFILAFLGWFVLMGKNGIRVGDWVEINGVGGEVVETGLFRIVMLETGNWTEKGHPTGRRTTLMNSFAIKGQYFNFSTTGQWMWDEITLTVPPAENTYRLIELIHKTVLQETEDDARVAEQEWKRSVRQKGLGQFAAAPAVDMRPGIYGIDITVRYITRAAERFEVRNRLYQRVIGLLQKPLAEQTLLKPVKSDFSWPREKEQI